MSRPFNIRLAESDEAWLRELSQRTGLSMAHVLVDGARRHYAAELAPEAFVVGTLEPYESITIATRPTPDGDVAEVVASEAKAETAGRKRPRPRPVEEIVRVEARAERTGRTTVELVAPPGDFAGVRIALAILPRGVPVEVRFRPEDLDPATRLPEA